MKELTKRKIECIYRLFEFGYESDIINFLCQSKLLKLSDTSNLRTKRNVAEVVYLALHNAEKDEELVLLSYEWKILPNEYINLTISTTREHKEFVYDS